VHAERPIYSVRITRDYRAVGVQKEESIIWFWIGSHEDYDRLLDRLWQLQHNPALEATEG